MALENHQGFYYHHTDTDTAAVQANVRQRFLTLALFLEQTLPPGRYRALCLSDLEAACQWALQTLAVAHGTRIDPFAAAQEAP
jgi:hypothetical protein